MAEVMEPAGRRRLGHLQVGKRTTTITPAHRKTDDLATLHAKPRGFPSARLADTAR